MTKKQKQRLLNVARALRESKEPKKFTMYRWADVCGSPACALGHYAARKDLQRTFEIRPPTASWELHWPFPVGGEKKLSPDSPEVTAHFGLSGVEADDLFGPSGCGDAQTTVEAAAFIEEFVATY